MLFYDELQDFVSAEPLSFYLCSRLLYSLIFVKYA